MDKDFGDVKEFNQVDDSAITNVENDFIEPGCVPVGVEEIDKKIGGLKKGSVVALLIDPKGVGEYFMYHLAAVAPTRYITTSQPKEQIERKLAEFRPIEESEDHDGTPDYIDIIDLNRETSRSTSSQTRLSNSITKEDGFANYIIDSFTLYAKESSSATGAARRIIKSTAHTQGITYLAFSKTEDFTESEREAIKLCDSVFTVGYEDYGNEQLRHRLTISRIRNNKDLTNQVFQLRFSGMTFQKDTRGAA
jgi:KaiC/GvpD/RAD55 family RecA-like ATPase